MEDDVDLSILKSALCLPHEPKLALIKYMIRVIEQNWQL